MNGEVIVPTIEAIIQKCSASSFGNPLVVNNLRSIVVEAIVSELLPEWRWCAHDWAGWDFEHPDGHRLEIKQSAALQTWKSTSRLNRYTTYVRERAIMMIAVGTRRRDDTRTLISSDIIPV